MTSDDRLGPLRTAELGVLAPAPAATSEQTLLNVIARAASDPQTDVDKLERLMGLYERHLAREAHAAFTAAQSLLQPELPEITEHGEIRARDGSVQSTYAKWEDIQAAIKPILAKYGFALTFAVEEGDSKLLITAKLAHRLGHVEQTTLPLPLDTSGSKNVVQSYGSSTSYGQRYTAKLLLNLTSRGEDDDGVAGGTKLVSAGEVEALKALVTNTGANLEKFCEVFKVASLDMLPAARFREAERALQDVAKRKRDAAARKKPAQAPFLEPLEPEQ